MLLDELPLTPNGKVDRKALPAPDAGQAKAVQYVAPRNAVEAAICEVWQEVLRRDQVGVEDNFFSLGGDSILSIRIVAMLQERGISIEIKDIFQHQTVAQLARQARTPRRDRGAATEPFALLTEEERAALGDEYEDAYPMSALQAGMVFHTQLEGFTGIYHDIMAEHVSCPWDEELFERALAACIEEHPVLRTGFLLDGSAPCRSSTGTSSCRWRWKTCAASPQKSRSSTSPRWTEQHKRLRLRLAARPALPSPHLPANGRELPVRPQLPPLRPRRLEPGRVHTPSSTTATSACSRAGSWTRQRRTGHTATSSPRSSASLADAEAKEYFAAMLEDAPAQQLPRAQDRRRCRTVASAQTRCCRGFTPLSGRLIELARQLGVPAQSVLLAAHFKVLSTMSGQTRAVTCITHNGRPESAGGERSLGLYLNSLPQSDRAKRAAGAS